MKEIDKGLIDFIFCDTFHTLTHKQTQKTFKSIKERDEYLKRVQQEVKTALQYLSRGENGKVGSSLIGINTFSMSTLGEKIFGKNAKRTIIWNKDKEKKGNYKGYMETRAYFMWGLVDRGWAYNLQENEDYFWGEYLQSNQDRDYSTALGVARDMVRRFTNRDYTVLEIDPKPYSVLKQAIELENRKYLSGKVKDGILYVSEK